MSNEYWIRKAHRYMGLFIGIQLLFWTVSGLYFAWNDIEKVRGEHLASSIEKVLNFQGGKLVSISKMLVDLQEQDPKVSDIESIELRLLLDQPVYEIKYNSDSIQSYLLVDAQTGESMALLDEATAVRLAKADFTEDVDVKSVELLHTDSAHAEYRGRDLPIYRVEMDHPSGVNIYVSARRGMVTARRNSIWRIFDFLWMLHTMDFETRDDFNNTLIKVFSVLGLITILSGFLLWGVSTPLFKNQKT